MSDSFNNVLENLNEWGLSLPFYKENERLTHSSKNNNTCSWYALDIEYYKEIVLNSRIFCEHFTNSRSKVKALQVTPSICTHHHSCAPQSSYLGIRYDLIDLDNNVFYKIKFSPYFVDEYKRTEFTLGIVFNNPLDISSLRKYGHFNKHFKLTKHTNFSPSHLYIYCLTNAVFSDGLDTTHINYKKDLLKLNEYAQKVNSEIPEAKFNCNDKGVFEYNKKIKLKSFMEKIKHIPFHNTSSYVVKHNS